MPAERPDGLLEVGRIGRPHGVRGDLYLDLLSDRTERVQPGARLYVRDQWRVVTRGHRHPPRWIVHLEGVDDRTVAAGLTGALVYAEPLGELPDVWWVHQLIGKDVVDQTGTNRGRCTAVVDNPAHDLLELEGGHLVPIPFVVQVTDSTVQVDVPDGLFD